MKFSTNDTAFFLSRAALGFMLLAHGILKFQVFTLAGTAGFFESVGFPGWLAYIVAPSEVALGLALVLGIYTRYAAGLSVAILLGALWVHLPSGWLFTNKNGGWEYPAFLVLAALSVSLQGGGRWALLKEAQKP